MADRHPSIDHAPLMTADGRLLRRALRGSLLRGKLTALLLIAPSFLFLLVLFVLPVTGLMTESVDDRLINGLLPRSFAIYDQWDGHDLPGEAHFKAMYDDIVSAEPLMVGKGSTRMNYAKSGWKSLMKKSRRNFMRMKRNEFEGPYKSAMIRVDKRWSDIQFWRSLGVMKDNFTAVHYLNSVDLDYDFKKNIISKPEERRIYQKLWARTLFISLLVTMACLILAYPVAYLLATLPLRYSNLLMICVLMPFWTSLLVRIVAWMIMLQQQGVVNDTLVWANILDDEDRLKMMYNFTGTVIVMTQVLLPFMILPIYSVMKGISPSYMRAAQNLGATPAQAFMKVYMPLTFPGVGAGMILVFILAIGYFITPELVGGKDGQMIGNYISYHLRSSLNWGLASAMGVMLLVAVLTLYWMYDRIFGIDNMKIG